MFILHYMDTHDGEAPTWAVIGEAMGWASKMTRKEYAREIRRSQRYGLRFDPTKAHSTKIHGKVIPLVREKIKEYLEAHGR